MALDLSSCRAKLDRAKAHVYALHADVYQANGNDGDLVLLGRQYEPESQAIVYRVKCVPQVRDSWGLLIGDAIHNYRSALDHLWWQLAVKKLGREPTKQEAKDIQFPILGSADDWLCHRYFRHIDPADAANVKPMQPFHHGQPGMFHPLAALNELSNTDKHRFLHPTVITVQASGARAPLPSDFRDCYAPDHVVNGIATIRIEHFIPATPKLGDPVLRVPVVATGPNPDVQLYASLTAQVTIGETWPMLRCLEAIDNVVTASVKTFDASWRIAERRLTA
jgi:hypothetical protein